MKKLYAYITLLSFISFLTSCTEDITPDFEFEEQVFISGLLTNEANFVSAQIQKTVPANANNTIGYVNDAQVSLFTKDTSNSISLVSNSFIVENGLYQTTEVITPVVGNTYWLEVILSDETLLKSEEETLKPSIPIKSMVKNEDTVKVTFTDQTEENNYYLIHVENFNEDLLISDDWFLFNDTVVTEELEEAFSVNNINEGDTLKVSIHNINFNTFQFYFNVLNDEDDVALSTLFLPINIVGNITNVTTNKHWAILALLDLVL